jgi:hypothetical protein
VYCRHCYAIGCPFQGPHAKTSGECELSPQFMASEIRTALNNLQIEVDRICKLTRCFDERAQEVERQSTDAHSAS